MTPKNDLAAQLAELNDSRHDPLSAEYLEALKNALADRSNHLAAKAAAIAGDREFIILVPDLIAAFERLMIKPIKSDPGCAAKTAIIETLLRLDANEQDLYLQAIRHRQMEPIYGGREDTAATLRATGALALVQIGYLDMMVELADLLADPETDARIGAARAIGYASSEASLPLLRFKLHVGDPEPAVSYECYTALLRLDPQASLTFIVDFINSEDLLLAEAAALAIGESRLPEAFPLLQSCWLEVEDSTLGRTLLLAMAMLRHKPAVDFLVSVVAEAPIYQAADALNALDMYRYDDEVWQRVEQTVAQRADPQLLRIASGK